MKKIGSGWTYNVYEYGEGKVLKKKKGSIERIWKIITSDPREVLGIFKTIRKLNELDKNSIKTIQNLKNSNFDYDTVANPILINKNVYLQNRCLTSDSFLEDTYKTQVFIDKYIQQITYFWTYGFADIVYNFTINNGLNPKGDIVLFDFNEITEDKEAISISIKNKIWLKRSSYMHSLQKEQKVYFKNKMEEYVTQENLNRSWRKNL